MAADESHDDKTQSFIALTSGTSVLHYKILEKIGAGGMGEVYLAEDTKLKRNVALKFLPPHLCQDENCRRRFKREAQAAAKLDHPNIVPVYEVSEFRGRPYFAMAHIEGRSLREVIKDGKLNIPDAINYTMQICEGLHKAHQAGVVHRDTKPSNIIIDTEDKPRIVDFGLASVSGEEKLTKTGSTLGTVGYMSPEQIEGKQTDQRSDLFSVGVILYEMLTGRKPFEGDNDAAVARSITDTNPEPIARYKSGTSGELQKIIDKALSKDPSLRYQHADGMLADLKRLKTASGSAKQSRLGLWAAGVVVLIVAIALFVWRPWNQTSVSVDSPMIAFLPFENLGDPEDEYFADGMTDELTSRLASISSLGVISRTSSMQYKNTTKSLRQIGKELGVGFVLEGTIRWDKSGDTNFVRILPQLIDVANDVHIWTDNYERPLTQIFDVQTDIANRIAQALDIALGGQEHRSLENRSIAKTEAYDYYLRGNEYYRRGTFHTGERDYYIAIDLYRQAIEIDPDFASAYAALALTHLSIYWSRLDRVEDRLMMAKEAVDRALDLDPELADAHLALAYYYYWGHRDYDRALSEAAIVLRNQPNNTEAYQITAFIKRRQGKWEEAIRNQERAIQLDPRDSNRFFANGFTHFLLRNYTQAEALYNTSLSLIPDAAHVYREKLFLYLAWKGDVKRARQVLEESTGKVNRARFALALARCDVLDRDYESALSRLSSPVIPPSEDSAKFYLAKADIYRLLNDSVASAACYDSVLVLSKANLANAVEAWPYLMTMAFAYAGLSDNEKAVRCAKTAVEQLPVTKDAIDGTGLLLKQANVYVMVGDYDQALDLIEYLLSHPSELSVPLLKIEPKWDPLRDHPRFQALIEKYEKEHAT